MERYKEAVLFANQGNLALANRNYQDTVESYISALKITREIERSRLVAVLLNRMGHILQAQGKIQDAVIAYESAFGALEKDTTFNLEDVVNQLSQIGKAYALSEPEPVTNLYTAKVAEMLVVDENDLTLVVKLWMNIGNAYLQHPQEKLALNAIECLRASTTTS